MIKLERCSPASQKKFYITLSQDDRRVVHEVELKSEGFLDLSGAAFENVTHVGKCAFSYTRGVKEITLPDKVRHIGECAFWGVDALWSVVGKSVVDIGPKAFYGCKKMELLYSPNLPNTGIGDEAFVGCRKMLATNLSSKTFLAIQAQSLAPIESEATCHRQSQPSVSPVSVFELSGRRRSSVAPVYVFEERQLNGSHSEAAADAATVSEQPPCCFIA